MKLKVKQNKGSVLWIALVAVVVAMGITMSMLQTSVGNFRAQEKYANQNSSFFTTHGTTELVMSDYWGRYNAQTATGTQNFMTWLNANVTFSNLNTNSGDKIGEDLRQGPASYTMVNATSIPTLDTPTKVYRAIPANFNSIVMGDRIITGVRLYKKERPKPGTYIVDLLVVAETQRNLGVNAATQNSMVAGMKAGAKVEYLQPQWEAQLFVFNSPPPFNGFDFAFLTKNLSCTLCHLHVRSRDRIDNQAKFLTGTAAEKAAAKNLFGTFDRVKVGVTDNMALREGSPQSVIEGTFYQRGQLQYENSYNFMTAADVESESIYTVEFNPNATTVKQDPNTGYVTAQNLHNETTDASLNPILVPSPGGNCYLNYSATAAGMTDGNLPGSNFPSPFPEIPSSTTLPVVGTVIPSGPNNKIDAAEIAAASTELVASSNPLVASSISGGIGLTLAGGVMYSANTLPTSGSYTPISASYTGNVILTGTTANPIKIDGKVLINGDVVLRGYVQGSGQIYATGNVYLPGDVIYNNVNVGTINEQFGKNSDTDPTKQSNLLGIMAGKNIMVGDYLAQVTTWSSGSADEFQAYKVNPTTKVLTSQMGQPDPGKLVYYDGTTTNNFLNAETVGGNIPTQNLGSGYKYPDGTSVSTSRAFGNGNFPNLIMQELAIFNRYEIMKSLKRLPTTNPTAATSYVATAGAVNPNYDANYIPKYYSLYKYDPVTPANTPAPVLLYNGMNWDNNKKTWNGVADPHSYRYFTGLDAMPAGSISDAAKYGKNVLNLHPDWITPANMMRIIADEGQKRVAVIADPIYGSSSNGYKVNDRRLDGVLYTKNAIFCIERSKGLKFNTSTSKWEKVNTLSQGRMQVNGAIIAPDTCILVNGSGTDDANINDNTGRKSFIVNYDTRVRTFLGLNNQDFGGFTTWAPRRVGITRKADFMPTAP